MRRPGWASGKAHEEAIAALWTTRSQGSRENRAALGWFVGAITQLAFIRASQTVNILPSRDTGWVAGQPVYGRWPQGRESDRGHGMSVGYPGAVDSALRPAVAGRTLRRRAYRGQGGLELSGRGLKLAHGGAHITDDRQCIKPRAGATNRITQNTSLTTADLVSCGGLQRGQAVFRSDDPPGRNPPPTGDLLDGGSLAQLRDQLTGEPRHVCLRGRQPVRPCLLPVVSADQERAHDDDGQHNCADQPPQPRWG